MSSVSLFSVRRGSSAASVSLTSPTSAELPAGNDCPAPPAAGRSAPRARPRIELPVGEVGPQHQERVAVHHRGVAGRKADEPRHADIVWIVVLDMLLAAQRVDDRRLQPLGQRHHLVVGTGAAGAAQQGDRPASFSNAASRSSSCIARPHHRLGRREPRRRCRPSQPLQRDVARNDDDRHAALADCRAHRALQDLRQLLRTGDQFDVVAAFP